MFLDYYQLREEPFGDASHPAQVYPSQTYCETLESLSESILSDCGSLALIAQAGMGKTTLLFQVLEGLHESGRSSFHFKKHCDSHEVLQFLLTEMQIDSSGMDAAAMQSKLHSVWFAELLAGRRFVLLFDDAEELDDSVLATLQALSKYETSNSKLMQIVLCGQAKLLETLQQEKFAQLRKHLSQVMRLQPLTAMETADYIRHRLRVAGHTGESLFTPEAMALVAQCSHGIFLNINKICSRSLLEAYARGRAIVTDDIIAKADRNLKASASPGVPSGASWDSGSSGTQSQSFSGGQLSSPFTQKKEMQVTLPGSGLWAGAIVGVLLSAGLALPHGMLRGMTHIMGGSDTPAASFMQSPPASQPNVSVAPADHAQAATAPTHALGADATKPALDALSAAKGSPDSPLSLTRELGLKINRIVIDAGHGGWDTGAKGPHGLMEKDVCLDVALRLGQLIEQNIPGAQVVYTRKDDTFVPLEERTAIANNADADLFISIHANSSGSSEVRGVETYYLSLATSKEAKELAIRENALTQSSVHDLPDLVKKIASNEKIAESRDLATDIQYTLSQRLQGVSSHEKNRGVKQAPFIVLTGANMPAVLSEISFVTNASDEILLSGESQRQRIADGLYRGISAYFNGLSGPQNKQKFLAENHAASPSGFVQAKADAGRKPL
jgi:N-acetylmuramoyl-L-alanine amidase/type II secretory pathway predicted ATPase ExeA